jgi:hypothetical protein
MHEAKIIRHDSIIEYCEQWLIAFKSGALKHWAEIICPIHGDIERVDFESHSQVVATQKAELKRQSYKEVNELGEIVIDNTLTLDVIPRVTEFSETNDNICHCKILDELHGFINPQVSIIDGPNRHNSSIMEHILNTLPEILLAENDEKWSTFKQRRQHDIERYNWPILMAFMYPFNGGGFCGFRTNENYHVLNNPKIKTSENTRGVQRFHSVSGPAIMWDDLEFHFIHGVRFGKDVWEKVTKREYSVVDIMKLVNTEQRRVALEYYGSDSMFKELDCDLIDWSPRGNKLWETEINVGESRRPMPMKVHFLTYTCPSTAREYTCFSDPSIIKADAAMAAKFGMTEEEYYTLRRENEA